MNVFENAFFQQYREPIKYRVEALTEIILNKHSEVCEELKKIKQENKELKELVKKLQEELQISEGCRYSEERWADTYCRELRALELKMIELQKATNVTKEND